jgi:hypothetical protein
MCASACAQEPRKKQNVSYASFSNKINSVGFDHTGRVGNKIGTTLLARSAVDYHARGVSKRQLRQTRLATKILRREAERHMRPQVDWQSRYIKVINHGE